MFESGQLAGKRALVTGGSRGIGAAIASRLAAEGAAVAVNYVANKSSADALVRELTNKGYQAAAFRADVADRAQTADMVARVVDEFGGLDILASNAGVEHFGALESITEADFDRVFRINVAGQLFATQAAVAAMKSGGSHPFDVFDQRAHRRPQPHAVCGQQGGGLGDGAEPGARVGRTWYRYQRHSTWGDRHRHGGRRQCALYPASAARRPGREGDQIDERNRAARRTRRNRRRRCVFALP